jgi:predicted SAM-dependent methyltransferase
VPFLRQRAGRVRRRLVRWLDPAAREEAFRTREAIAAAFLNGNGIEIGAAHQPLVVPASVRVKHVDRLPAPELRKHYPDMIHAVFAPVDIIDDGETLTSFEDSSQDFIIANHFIEHCQNPIRTFQNFFRVLKPDGIAFVAVPDKRFTFDADRPSTTIDHVRRDFLEGPEWSEQQHLEEWSRIVNKRGTDDQLVQQEVQHLMNIGYRIHYHAWAAKDLQELLVALREFVHFELELFLRNGFETILVLRKTS